MKLLAPVSGNLPWPGPKKPVHRSKINKGVRARNRVMNAAMWEDRKLGFSYGYIARKYGFHDPMQVRNRFRYYKLPFRELTQELVKKMSFVDPAKKKEYNAKYRASRGWGVGTGPTKFNLQVNDTMHAEVKACAARRKVSISELIRTYIEWGLENDDDARRQNQNKAQKTARAA